MKYFPKSRIIQNQRANLNEFTTPNGKAYSGPYYTTFTGESFTGVNPATGSSIPLISVISFDDTGSLGVTLERAQYDRLNSNLNVDLTDPIPFTPRPTEADYAAGKITRYFARQRNGTQFKIMEIDKTTYDTFSTSIGNPTTALWKVISIFWQISGPKRTQIINGIRTQAGIIDTNQRILDQAEKNFIGIKQYLSNLTQFAR